MSSKWYGCQVILADRYYPSTKRCSHCGNVKAEMGLGQRSYVYDVCGMVMDRDLNAAINLEQLWFRMELPRVPREATPVERV